jgi:arylsulfatase A-like enzyme
MADQLRRQSCGYAGDALAQTPNIDRLADEGVSFENAVVSMPVCSAYRASLFTGKYATSTGMVINEIRLNPDHHPHCLARCLADADYELGYIGKWHLWANQLGNHGDPENSFVPRGPHRLGFDGYWAAYNFHHNYYGESAYYHEESPEKVSFPERTYEPDGQTDMAIDYIKVHADKDKPFALVLSVGTPHDPWVKSNVPEEYYAMFQDVEFDVPSNWQQEADAPYGDDWSDMEKTPEMLNEWMRVYYAMTANLDWNIGRLQNAIREAGIENDTLFVFTSDHGECFGAHGRMKKNIFYEEAARVPMLVKWPALIPAGHKSDACLSNVDIMPTLLGLIGVDIPDEVEGIDLSLCARAERGPEPEFAFLQNTGACAAWEDGHEWRAIRTKQYTYAVYKVDGKELLFDNTADPYQMVNLLDQDVTDLGSELSRKLETKMAELKDGFEVSSFYRDNWVSKDRLILRTAKNS